MRLLVALLWVAWIVVLADCAYTILRALRTGHLRLRGGLSRDQPGYWSQLILLILFFATGVLITVRHLSRR